PSQILGSAHAPIPLTKPIGEHTPEPEPIQDDQILLSRHTVPANQPVLLTQPTKTPSGAVGDTSPIPLTSPVRERTIPKLRVQRLSSVVAKLYEVRNMEFEPGPGEDDWEPIKSALTPASGIAHDQEPTFTEYPMTRDAIAGLRAGVASAVAMPQNGNVNG